MMASPSLASTGPGGLRGRWTPALRNAASPSAGEPAVSLRTSRRGHLVEAEARVDHAPRRTPAASSGPSRSCGRARRARTSPRTATVSPSWLIIQRWKIIRERPALGVDQRPWAGCGHRLSPLICPELTAGHGLSKGRQRNLRMSAGQKLNPPGLPLRSAIRPASVAIAISAGRPRADVEADRPVHAGDLLRRHAQLGQRRDVRGRVPRVAHDADPAGVAGQRVAQHRRRARAGDGR